MGESGGRWYKSVKGVMKWVKGMTIVVKGGEWGEYTFNPYMSSKDQ